MSNCIAEVGQCYCLTITKEGFPSVLANDTVPFTSKIIDARKERTGIVDEYGIPIYEYSLSFECDSLNFQNYELMFLSQSVSKDDGYFFIAFNPFDVEPDPIISKVNQTLAINSYFFSSESINGNRYTLKMKMKGAWQAGGYFELPIIQSGERNIEAVVLRSVSQAYVDYRISWQKHKMLMNDSSKIDDLLLVPLIGQQQEVYSNVENGKGIFVSFNQSYFIFD